MPSAATSYQIGSWHLRDGTLEHEKLAHGLPCLDVPVRHIISFSHKHRGISRSPTAPSVSLTKGMRVILSGRLKQRSYETKEGEKRTVFEVEVDEVGPSLRNATAKVTRAQRAGGTTGGFSAPAATGGESFNDDPWAAASTTTNAGGGWATTTSEEPPF